MPTLRYHRVDVFTDRPFGGNPLAVFPHADEVDAETMQAIAREMNLSETVFCLRPSAPDAEVRMRIFTVNRELPLAGHPVVGAHFVLATTGRYQLAQGRNVVRGQLEAGVLPVEILVEEGEVREVLMTQRSPSFAPAFKDVALVGEALGLEVDDLCPADLPIRLVDTGVPWLIVPVRDLRALRRVTPNFQACTLLAERAGSETFYAFTQETEDPTCAVRARHVWFGRVTPGEDPVTGSAAGCLGAYLVHENVLLAAPTAEVRIEQGVEIGRPGVVDAFVDVEGKRIQRVRVGGRAVHVGDGELRW
ncbi:MAG TPA: PhzF family phenazine biosynthesis protein [Planctomycetota bacterium]|nr:PhzF family phenazine biosynthesis protein [Planctomycetota bacterium]